jgi:biopolymer transport protein ExbD
METDPADLPDTITVTIREDKVYVEDKEIADADALKSYIETINTDDRKYKLVDDNSIRATYEWVTGVFDELKIPLSEE